MQPYTSRTEWDTNINSVGGMKSVHLVSSPWSQIPSANSTQGVLTSGVLINEFAPPQILIEPAVDGYYYQDRVDMGRINKRAASINGPSGTEGGSNQTVTSSLPSGTEIAAATAPKTPASTAVPDAVVTPTVTPSSSPASTVSADGTVTAATETYVAPSRRNVKNNINPSRVRGYGAKKESYNPGIPGLVGSNLHHEAFNRKEQNSIIIILLTIITCCIVGSCFGFVGSRAYREPIVDRNSV